MVRPEEDQMLLSRSALARIITTLAGRVTEQVVFGNPEVTTGASIYNKLLLLHAKWLPGMSNIGPINEVIMNKCT
jgi:cell division protease FtsH